MGGGHMIRDFLLGCFINGLIAIALALFNGAETQTDARYPS